MGPGREGRAGKGNTAHRAVGKDSFPVENDALATRNDDFAMGMNCISDLVDPQLAKMAFLG